MFYKRGYKYQIVATEEFRTPIFGRLIVNHDWISLYQDGRLHVHRGYAWDGPSGPTFDTRDFMRASLAHDALYQLMGDGLLPADLYRKIADDYLVQVCREDGMPAWRRAYVRAAVRLFGARLARQPDKLLEAP